MDLCRAADDSHPPEALAEVRSKEGWAGSESRRYPLPPPVNQELPPPGVFSKYSEPRCEPAGVESPEAMEGP